MVKGIIAVAFASFLVVLYCCLVLGGRQDEVIEDMYPKMTGIASGKDEE